MAYSANIPQPTDRIKDSQPLILANFQDIAALITINHATFGDADQGKHKFITFPQLPTGSIAIPAAPAANNLQIYSATFAGATSNPNLFLQRSAGTPVPFTASVTSTSGYAFLPGNILLQWGAASGGPGNSAAISFTRSFAAAAYNVQITPRVASATVFVVSAGAASFVFNASVAANIYYFAVGQGV